MRTIVTAVALDDAQVIAASLGDGERFAELFDRHGAAVHRYLARRLGPDAADDCAGEVFLAAFRRRAAYVPHGGGALPWLYGIAANAVAQHRREEARRWKLLAALPIGGHDQGHAEDTDDRVTAQANRQSLVRGLESLAPPDREILLLVAWEQLTQREAAAALSIPYPTARTRLHRARQQLRAHLRADGDPSARATLQELLGYE
jgi:RNA polymerase sigma factor (sigma-70 family)